MPSNHQAAKRLWQLRGEFKKLTKPEVYALLSEALVSVHVGGKTREPRLADALKEVLWPSQRSYNSNRNLVCNFVTL